MVIAAADAGSAFWLLTAAAVLAGAGACVGPCAFRIPDATASDRGVKWATLSSIFLSPVVVLVLLLARGASVGALYPDIALEWPVAGGNGTLNVSHWNCATMLSASQLDGVPHVYQMSPTVYPDGKGSVGSTTI